MKKRVYVTAALLVLAALIAFSGQVQQSARDALLLCAETIIPSLFPFFVLSILLNRLGLPDTLGRFLGRPAGALFGVSGEGASALFIGLTGGYPLGASYIADMCVCGRIDRDEGQRLLAFCNNSGPAFIIGAVGVGAFGSASAGLILYGVHILSSVLTGMVFAGKRNSNTGSVASTDESDLDSAFPDSVKNAVTAVLNVCGFVVIFSVITGLMDSTGYFSRLCLMLGSVSGLGADFIRALLTGLLELGNGAGALRYLPLSPSSLSLAAFLLGFGSISVHCQTAAVISRAKLKGTLHFAGRLSMAFISAVLAFVAGIIFLE